MATALAPLILPTAAGTLVFGMDWFPMLGGQSGKAGMKLARRHRSTHLVPPVTALGSIGLVSLKRQRPSRKIKMYSAAQNVAQLFSTGSVALLIELPQMGYWLVAIHEGAVVTRTDQVYLSLDDAGEVIDSLSQAYPQLQVLSQEQDNKLPTLDGIAAASASCSQLQPVRRWQSAMPWPVQGFVLALVLVLLLPRALPLFHGAQTSVPEPPVLNPAQAWRLAVTASANRHRVHGRKGMRTLIDSFLALPTSLGGWALQRAICKPEAGRWLCQAEYERQDVKASNSSFLASSLPAWKAEFSSLDRVSVGWQIESHDMPLLQASLSSSAQTERDLLSALQGIRPSFLQMQIGQPVPIPLVVPKDQQGRPLPRPKEQMVYASRPVQIAGPLRSAILLLPNAETMSWLNASLTINQADKVGLTSSKLNLSLQGHIYEIDNAMDGGSGTVMCVQLDDGRCAGP
ncbi:type 4b pilus protein PilO2 [Pollutimonas harenae]|uniref:Type 4b pilus protein PilO2 n=1 Tax=Pollutimonas harenae TaxID=657015 RepID=A0A853H1U8_9BURK|nr:type 4b pilus protein PilO2 [Pollutimonas harenae]NYT85769.1 type 4b pilus protein PilO2 [Pollutimonas harenae]TEA70834.1 hypothetical protein ERD84_09225 [Pollutimonas harenae]